jgi:hypothetical protein
MNNEQNTVMNIYTHKVENDCGWSQGAMSNVMRLAALPEFTLQTVTTQFSKHQNAITWFELRHKDGRAWILSMNCNERGIWVTLHDYKSKNGYYKQATDANSVAFDKMNERLLNVNRHGETF